MRPRSIHTNLPAPLGGMHLAQRPTGVTMGIVVSLAVFVAISVPTIAWMVVLGILTAAEVDIAPFERATPPISLLSFAFGLLALWLWLRFKERRPFASLGFTIEHSPARSSPDPARGSEPGASARPDSWLRRAVRGFAVGLAMITLCVAVPVLSGQAHFAWASPDATAWLVVLGMLLAFLVQGSTEEILTRGFLSQAVARRWGLIAAVAIQAAFFTLLHGANPGMGLMPIVNLVLFAVFASLMTLAEGSLWGVCALHGVWNWAQGNLYGAAVSGSAAGDSLFVYTPAPGSSPLLTGGEFGAEGSIVTTLVYLFGAVVAWRVFRRRRATSGSQS